MAIRYILETILVSLGVERKKQGNELKKVGITIVLIVYCVLNIILIMHHEAWRDEAQAWCIAKNLSVKEIFKLMATEGHLMPWFLILKTFYLLGGEFAWISIISLIVMVVTALIILVKSPFPSFMKVLLVFSPLCFYYNAVIARCYCLVSFALVCTAYLRKIRDYRPIIYGLSVALVMQTHVLILPLGLALTIESFIELFIVKKNRNSKNYLSILIQFVSLIFAVMELYQGNKPTSYHVTPKAILSRVEYNSVTSNFRTITDRMYTNSLSKTIALIAIALFLIVTWYSFIDNHAQNSLNEILIVLVGLLGYISIVALIRACDHIQMALIFYELLMFGLWIVLDRLGNEAKVSFYSICLLAIVVILSFFNEFVDIKFELTNNYSNSKEMARDIVEEIPYGSTIYVNQSDTLTSVYAYVGDKRKDISFWDVDVEEPFKCIIRGSNIDRKTPINRNDRVNMEQYWLTDRDCADMDNFQMIMSETGNNKWDEVFYLYQFGDESSD